MSQANPSTAPALAILQIRCARLGLIAPPNPTPIELILIVSQAIHAHRRHPASGSGPWSADYCEWKDNMDALQELLSQLRALSSPPPALPALASEPKASQARTNPESHPNQPRNDPEPKADQTRPDPGTILNQNAENPQNRPQSASHSVADVPKIHKLPSRKVRMPQANREKEKIEEEENEIGEEDSASPGGPFKPEPLSEKQLSNLSLQELQAFAVKKFLPDPKNSDLKDYAQGYMDIYGPPPALNLNKLSGALASFILSLLEEHSLKWVEQRLMMPPPYGLYLRTCKSSLRRFRIRSHRLEAKRNSRSLQKHVRSILAQPNISSSDFSNVTEQLLGIQLIENALHPEPDLLQTKSLLEMLEKIHAGKLAERKLALAESKA